MPLLAALDLSAAPPQTASCNGSEWQGATEKGNDNDAIPYRLWYMCYHVLARPICRFLLHTYGGFCQGGFLQVTVLSHTIGRQKGWQDPRSKSKFLSLTLPDVPNLNSADRRLGKHHRSHALTGPSEIGRSLLEKGDIDSRFPAISGILRVCCPTFVLRELPFLSSVAILSAFPLPNGGGGDGGKRTRKKRSQHLSNNRSIEYLSLSSVNFQETLRFCTTLTESLQHVYTLTTIFYKSNSLRVTLPKFGWIVPSKSPRKTEKDPCFQESPCRNRNGCKTHDLSFCCVECLLVRGQNL